MAYLQFETAFNTFVNNDSNLVCSNKFKTIAAKFIFGATLILTNELVKNAINGEFEKNKDDILFTIGTYFLISLTKETTIVGIWKTLENWWYKLEGFSFLDNILLPCLFIFLYFDFNILQTCYQIYTQKLLVPVDFIPTFLQTVSNNTINGSFRIIASSLFCYCLSNIKTKWENKNTAKNFDVVEINDNNNNFTAVSVTRANSFDSFFNNSTKTEVNSQEHVPIVNSSNKICKSYDALC